MSDYESIDESTEILIGPHVEKCVCGLCWPLFIAASKAHDETFKVEMTPEKQALIDEMIAEILSESKPVVFDPLPAPSVVTKGMRVIFHTRGTDNGRIGTVVKLAKKDGRRIEVRLDTTPQYNGTTVFTDNGEYSCLTEVK